MFDWNLKFPLIDMFKSVWYIYGIRYLDLKILVITCQDVKYVIAKDNKIGK